MNYWLLKSEPTTYSIERLEAEGETLWDGVRNYQARNFLKQMRPGDQVFFYHSNTAVPGIVGLAKVIETNVVDPTQFNPKSEYYDAKSTQDVPRWHTVVVLFQQKFSHVISLNALKNEFGEEDFAVVKKGSRLSVVPIAKNIALRLCQKIHRQPD